MLVTVLDVLIRGGLVIDGTGQPGFLADVGIRGDRIVEVGPARGRAAARVVDAEGLYVCPGFIDMHTHSDIQLLAHPEHHCKVRQGVTLDVIGQDGLGYAPTTPEVMNQLRRQLAGWNDDPPGFDWGFRTVGEYLGRFDERTAINVAYLVPHGTLRMIAVGMDDRAATDGELARMKSLVVEAMEQGAVGLSSGLTYVPGMFGSDDELVELCKVLAPYGGYYCPHHRNYGLRAIEAYGDCIAIARRANVPLHIAHAHVSFECNRGRAPELLAMIDAARAAGTDVTFDAYPYVVAATYLHAVLPSWVSEGGHDATIARLRDPALRARLTNELERTGSDGFHDLTVDWSRIVVSGVRRDENRRFVGMSVEAAAQAAEKSPVDFFCDLLVAEELGVSSLLHIGIEENVRTMLSHPAQTGGSDGILVGDCPHPRGWGTFPRYLGLYVRELGLASWEEMVRRLTSQPAARLGLRDRGLVKTGMAADLVCFDPTRVRDAATFENPRAYPEGISYVLVNGKLVIEGGRHTGVLAGRALRRGSATSRSPAT
jgi:N-acyl-D-amino-acid deacylase